MRSVRIASSRAAGRLVALSVAGLLWAEPAFPQPARVAALDGPPLVAAATRPAVGVQPHPGAVVPGDLAFTDSDGHATHLGEAYGGPPVLLVLGYYRCKQLCGVVAQGVLEALHDSGLPPQASRLVFISIDPLETPGDAAARLKVDLDYARFLQGRDAPATPPWLRLLTGSRGSIDRLTRTVGVVYRDASTPARDGAPATRGFAHPAAVIVLTPDGRISRYLGGARFDAGELRDAVVDADDGEVGHSPLRLVLQCLHLADSPGSHDAAVMRAVRVAMGFLLGIFGAALLALNARRRHPHLDAPGGGAR